MTTRPTRIRIRLGILAGSGPEAGIDIWQKLLSANRAALGDRFRGDVDAPHVVIESVPELGLSRDLEAHRDQVWRELRRAAARLAGQVDVFVIAGSTLEVFAGQLAALRLPARLVTHSEVMAAEVRRRRLTTATPVGGSQATDTFDVNTLLAEELLRHHQARESPTPAVTTSARIAVLYTGGTLGMVDRGDGLEPTADLEHRLRAVLDGRTDTGSVYQWHYAQPASVIDSAESDEHTAPRLADAVRGLAADPGLDGVVVIHGTDTLAYNAARVAFETTGVGIPVVFTGSQLPLGAENTDAPDNLRDAAAAIVEHRAPAGTSIAFDGEVLPAVRATKASADELHAFRARRPLAPNAQPLPLLAAPLRSHTRIGAYRFTPGSDAASLRAAIAAHPDGLVLECYGAGTGPVGHPGVFDALRTGIDAGTPIVAVTQCDTGSVRFDRYAISADLAAAGVIPASDMTLEAALGKLAAITGRGLSGAALIDAFTANTLGEYTPEQAVSARGRAPATRQVVDTRVSSRVETTLST